MRLPLCTGLLIALLGLARAADHEQELAAGIDNTAKAAYFVLSSAGYVFALNVADNGDVYYHMNAPATNSWMGVGFGSSMKDTRMLISYISNDGHSLTNTCRMASGHSEPEHESDCLIENVSNDTYAPYSNTLSPDGIMIAHAVCRNCSSWATGSIDVRSVAQPFIYALGPNQSLHSDDLNANLRLHRSYGVFNLDMTVATNYTGWYGRVPAPQDPGLQVGDSFWAFANYFSSNAYDAGTLADWAPVAHAVFMCLAFLLVFPLGAISLRLVRRARIHAAAQMVGVGFVVIGFAFGFYASKLYNKSRSFKSAHQRIGLLIFAVLFVQIGLGLSHHLIFMRSGLPTIMGKLHRVLGISILVLAVVNGGLGIDFAGSSSANVPYGIVVAIMTLIMAGLTTVIFLYNRRHVYKPEKVALNPSHYHDSDPNGEHEYEMHERPFATMGHIQTPRTPLFATQKWDTDPENYRAHIVRSNTAQTAGQDSLYADTPASEYKDNPFKGKWEAVPLP